MFLRARRPLGAAVLLAELIRSGSGAAEVWCGLGAALLGAREALEVRPFERWAAWVLRDAEPVVLGTPFAQPRLDLARDLPPPAPPCAAPRAGSRWRRSAAPSPPPPTVPTAIASSPTSATPSTPSTAARDPAAGGRRRRRWLAGGRAALADSSYNEA